MHSNASSNRTGRSDSLREGWIDTGTALLCLVPLLLTTYLPLPDLPDHLARQYILRDWASSPQLQVFYVVHWSLVPNLFRYDNPITAARPVTSPRPTR
jgi:hypothetical protein